MKRQEIEQAFQRDWKKNLADLNTFLSFPSISAQPDSRKDCQACAVWLAAHLTSIGLRARLLETGANPVVFAERAGSPDKPTILFYGHYDVQPIDPVDAWDTPPFTPTLKGGRIYCRGAQDNKGQIFAVINAVGMLLRNKQIDNPLKFFIEGNEEAGQSVVPLLPKWKKLLKSDILMVSDCDMDMTGVPAICMGLRGVIAMTATLTGPKNDLHSGQHGGVAPNPATAMARLVATLHKADGSIAIPGYYSGVRKPSRKEIEFAEASDLDEAEYKRLIGVPPVAGENHYSPVVRLGFRPTIEINGIHSGYGGEGSKTIIPASALLKLTSRIVAGQDPKKCVEMIITHLKKHAPDGLTLTVTGRGWAGAACKLDVNSPLAARARRILDTFGCGKTVFRWSGASIPIVPELARISGADPLLVGFGRDEDKIHAPNESYSIQQLKMNYVYTAAFLTENQATALA